MGWQIAIKLTYTDAYNFQGFPSSAWMYDIIQNAYWSEIGIPKHKNNCSAWFQNKYKLWCIDKNCDFLLGLMKLVDYTI